MRRWEKVMRVDKINKHIGNNYPKNNNSLLYTNGHYANGLLCFNKKLKSSKTLNERKENNNKLPNK